MLRAARRTAVLVTHDLLDVLAVADAVVVLEHGAVVEEGSTLEVLTRPRSGFAASLAGVNLLPGRLRPDGAVIVPPAAPVRAGTPTAGPEPGPARPGRPRLPGGGGGGGLGRAACRLRPP